VKKREDARAMTRKVPFHVPSIGEEEIAEVVDTLRTGWLTTGPKTRRFEQDFASYVGARHAVAVNSCTAGLHLGLEAVEVRAGDEVIIPTYTFTATGEVVTYLGARPVLADVRRDTFNLDARTIEPLITERTKAVIPVHVAGQVCDMDPILDLARHHGFHVIDDAAHTLPATYKGRSVGTMADATVFSFYATKTITTGEGGMVTTEREDLASRMRQMSLHGLSGNAWNRYGDKGSWYYEVLEFGFKYNMTDIAAAIGLRQLRRCDAFWKRRREIAALYSEAFDALDTCVTPRATDHGSHSWHLYILQLNLAALTQGRDEIVKLLRERGIHTSVHFIPLHLHPAYQKAFGYRAGAFPAAEGIFAGAVSLPIYPDMTNEDVAYVTDVVRDTLATCRR
jgi:perosamine synthetase